MIERFYILLIFPFFTSTAGNFVLFCNDCFGTVVAFSCLFFLVPSYTFGIVFFFCLDVSGVTDFLLPLTLLV